MTMITLQFPARWYSLRRESTSIKAALADCNVYWYGRKRVSLISHPAGCVLHANFAGWPPHSLPYTNQCIPLTYKNLRVSRHHCRFKHISSANNVTLLKNYIFLKTKLVTFWNETWIIWIHLPGSGRAKKTTLSGKTIKFDNLARKGLSSSKNGIIHQAKIPPPSLPWDTVTSTCQEKCNRWCLETRLYISVYIIFCCLSTYPFLPIFIHFDLWIVNVNKKYLIS